MSYTTADLHIERTADINTAITQRDSERLHFLAQQEMREGNDEIAEELLMKARRIEREDWAYDESISN